MTNFLLDLLRTTERGLKEIKLEMKEGKFQMIPKKYKRSQGTSVINYMPKSWKT